MFLLEAPHRGDYNKENHLKLSKFCNYGIFSKGLKNEFETAMVNEPSVFEPLKFYCSSGGYLPEGPSININRFSPVNTDPRCCFLS